MPVDPSGQSTAVHVTIDQDELMRPASAVQVLMAEPKKPSSQKTYAVSVVTPLIEPSWSLFSTISAPHDEAVHVTGDQDELVCPESAVQVLMADPEYPSSQEISTVSVVTPLTHPFAWSLFSTASAPHDEASQVSTPVHSDTPSVTAEQVAVKEADLLLLPT